MLILTNDILAFRVVTLIIISFPSQRYRSFPPPLFKCGFIAFDLRGLLKDGEVVDSLTHHLG